MLWKAGAVKLKTIFTYEVKYQKVKKRKNENFFTIKVKVNVTNSSHT